ncbi:hypothetical protein E3N88_30832 [Mikania micrantha]|uniref:Uncharacterized protein n=1 Tax=Mikania micrantha TaxID=192012 RepID=A0A5N6MNB5_9ASTR|nr:hypothetical protein E3N88_30832 [Mikania micrantha]
MMAARASPLNSSGHEWWRLKVESCAKAWAAIRAPVAAVRGGVLRFSSRVTRYKRQSKDVGWFSGGDDDEGEGSYEKEVVGEPVNADFFSITVDGVSDHELHLDDVVKQRQQLQHIGFSKMEMLHLHTLQHLEKELTEAREKSENNSSTTNKTNAKEISHFVNGSGNQNAPISRSPSLDNLQPPPSLSFSSPSPGSRRRRRLRLSPAPTVTVHKLRPSWFVVFEVRQSANPSKLRASVRPSGMKEKHKWDLRCKPKKN